MVISSMRARGGCSGGGGGFPEHDVEAATAAVGFQSASWRKRGRWWDLRVGGSMVQGDRRLHGFDVLNRFCDTCCVPTVRVCIRGWVISVARIGVHI